MVTETLAWASMNLEPKVGSNDAGIGVLIAPDRVGGKVIYEGTLEFGGHDVRN